MIAENGKMKWELFDDYAHVEVISPLGTTVMDMPIENVRQLNANLTLWLESMDR